MQVLQAAAGGVHLAFTAQGADNVPWQEASAAATASAQAPQRMRFLPVWSPNASAGCMHPQALQHLPPAPQDLNSAEQTVHCIGPSGFPAWNVVIARMPEQEGAGQGMVPLLSLLQQGCVL